jgi:hypothetical protein
MRCCGYEEFFDEKLARKDAERYRRKGLRASGTRMVELLRGRGIEGAEVLEIGGGVGAIGIELVRSGAARATVVELSASYDEAAAGLVREYGLEGRVERLHGDVVEDGFVSDADVVVMERVVCCYPDAPALVGAAARRARRSLVLTYPRDGLPTRVAVRAANLLLRMRGGSFRVYAHAPATIGAAAAAQGLQQLGPESGVVWRTAAFERPALYPSDE